MPVFEDEKSKASDEKSVKQKIALKKTARTNIIAKLRLRAIIYITTYLPRGQLFLVKI